MIKTKKKIPSLHFYISNHRLTSNSLSWLYKSKTKTNLPELKQELSTWLIENGYASLRAARICTEYTHLQAKHL